ncbi:cytochrome c oxidase subunit 3 [Microvirga sp. STS02]|uniref:cytochrome c oxidase subunit 3 n=1 Tax=Hymenobacter negativus TaxID=2795026 RepID=UPI0018DCDAD9|nr:MULTISPECIES: cytochrome c oxidase subunit 3 [Bacteria]MBH8568854.1 cytochrome c oxidase subunit 3 [Hymenobacter negativus]MBR7208588.1 cytochrome c oxidase subunit 3 [Microvirga sp. STS02]
MNPSETLSEKEVGLGWHPKRVLLILLIFSIVMMFAAFTSGYIVRRDEGNWREFELPGSLLINSILIALSSASMQWAYFSARKDEISRIKTGLIITLVLGLAFLVGQYHSFGDLVAGNTYFGGADANPSGSFVYVLMGVHAFHLVTGLIFLAVVLKRTLNYQVHSRALLSIGNATLYWHFLGGLWLYLYLFLLLNH